MFLRVDAKIDNPVSRWNLYYPWFSPSIYKVRREKNPSRVRTLFIQGYMFHLGSRQANIEKALIGYLGILLGHPAASCFVSRYDVFVTPQSELFFEEKTQKKKKGEKPDSTGLISWTALISGVRSRKRKSRAWSNTTAAIDVPGV